MTPLSALQCVLMTGGVCFAVYGYVVARFMTVTQYVCESNLGLRTNHTKVRRRPDIHSPVRTDANLYCKGAEVDVLLI